MGCYSLQMSPSKAAMEHYVLLNKNSTFKCSQWADKQVKSSVVQQSNPVYFLQEIMKG